MFRDPFFYCSLRENVVPLLRTWPHIKIWHAGCATGEEVYSMAIILKEEGLYERSTIYATDFNDESLEKARAGVYEIPKLKEATGSYNEAGGKGSFSEYYHACYDAVTMDPTLKERIVFANHNLVSDSSFGEMHLIVCRNVLIYFDKELKDRALGLFTESLVNGGLLCLGTKEDLHFSSESNHYDAVDKKAKIFRKRG
jgi:chemotaxis protein methyltransferase CheR